MDFGIENKIWERERARKSAIKHSPVSVSYLPFVFSFSAKLWHHPPIPGVLLYAFSDFVLCIHTGNGKQIKTGIKVNTHSYTNTHREEESETDCRIVVFIPRSFFYYSGLGHYLRFLLYIQIVLCESSFAYLNVQAKFFK